MPFLIILSILLGMALVDLLLEIDNIDYKK